MKTRTLVLSAFVCLLGTASAWSFYRLSRADARPLDTKNLVPGRVFAYSLAFPFDDLDSVGLEIRRLSTNRDKRNNVASVNGNLNIPHENADMIISTSSISSPEIRNGVLVSAILLELKDILDEKSTADELAITGQVAIAGVSSKLSPAKNFLRGGSLSTAWEQHPNWIRNEMCVGRFRTQDENQIYDYTCVVVASNSDWR